jgi:5,5'-dehydrodivanillate O-demethylase
MLSAKENERLTQVGPGTPMGELLRRYWHPIVGGVEMDREPTKAVRLLGEDLVLYRDRSGVLGLVGQACAHRRVNLLYGIPEQKGLRCPYHGWLYDETGRCLEQPAEAPDSTFKERIRIPAYPVQELGGLIFAYLGPQPAPLLPRWDLLVWDHAIKDVGVTVVPCNWLQAMENSLDPVHTEWLHGRFFKQVLERMGQAERYLRPPGKHLKIGFDVFDHGIIKRRVLEGETEEDDDWKVGHPVVFPNILRVGGMGNYGFQWRTPMDDTHTLHVMYTCHLPLEPGVQAPKQERVPVFPLPLRDASGKYVLDMAIGQDFLAWIEQGEIADRSVEKLGESDKGIILLRRLLREQLAKVAEGVDPMNVFRDAAANVCINLPQEENKYNMGRRFTAGNLRNVPTRYSPLIGQITEMQTRSGA